jgi:hypothetical protein
MKSKGGRYQYVCYHQRYGFIKFLEEEGDVRFGDPLSASRYKRERWALDAFKSREWRTGSVELLVLEDIEVMRVRISWETVGSLR